MASIHTPSSLNTSLGIIGALILGDLSIRAGWVCEQAVFTMAIVGLSAFTTPSIEFAMGIRIFRLFLLIATGLFRLPGFIVGIIIVMLITITTKSASENSYIWPIFPFNSTALKHILFREPVPKVKKYGEK